jgi:hypothetical protein
MGGRWEEGPPGMWRPRRPEVDGGRTTRGERVQGEQLRLRCSNRDMTAGASNGHFERGRSGGGMGPGRDGPDLRPGYENAAVEQKWRVAWLGLAIVLISLPSSVMPMVWRAATATLPHRHCRPTATPFASPLCPPHSVPHSPPPLRLFRPTLITSLGCRWRAH